jgi:quercetin dioxygenase-like cupin family protein
MLEITRVDEMTMFSSDKYSRILVHNAKGLLRLLCFQEEQSVPLHRHPHADEYFYVIGGKAKVTVGKEHAEVESGSIVKAPAGVPHQWKNGSQELVLLSVLIPLQSYEFADDASEMELV